MLQPPEERLTYFEVLGIRRPTFRIAKETLDANYRALQRLLHPDRFVRRSDVEKEFSAQHATLVNEAYTTLRSPRLRAAYLLDMRGEGLAAHPHALAPDELMHFLELQDEVAETTDAGRLADLEAETSADVARTLDRFEAGYAAGDFAAARAAMARLNFLRRIEDAVREQQ